MAIKAGADDGRDDPRINNALVHDRGRRMSRLNSRVIAATGSPTAVTVAVLVTVAWLAGGLFVPGGYTRISYQWLLSTVASVVTFVTVFVIQYSHNRNSRSTQTKLDAVADMLATMVKQQSLRDSEYRPHRLAGTEHGTAGEIDRRQARMRRRPDDTPHRPAQSRLASPDGWHRWHR